MRRGDVLHTHLYLKRTPNFWSLAAPHEGPVLSQIRCHGARAAALEGEAGEFVGSASERRKGVVGG